MIPADTPAGSYVLHTMNDGTETPGHTLGLPSQIAGRWGVPVLLDNGMRLVHCNLERFQPAQLTLGIRHGHPCIRQSAPPLARHRTRTREVHHVLQLRVPLPAMHQRTEPVHPRVPAEAPAMTDWKDTAPCKGLSKLFFPAHNERPKAGVIREAKALAICARCPHRTPCKEIADTMPSEPRGIFGGVIYRDMTDRSRQQRKQKAMTA